MTEVNPRGTAAWNWLHTSKEKEGPRIPAEQDRHPVAK
jgi:hypothetical protein